MAAASICQLTALPAEVQHFHLSNHLLSRYSYREVKPGLRLNALLHHAMPIFVAEALRLAASVQLL